MNRAARLVAAIASCVLPCALSSADTIVYFADCQASTQIDSGVTSDTISSKGYLFTYTRDKLFTGGTGQPIGRPVRVPWPTGVEAQAVTTPPPGVIDYKARITLQRVDGQVFDLTAFTAMLLANTAATGAAIEIMPLVNGEDAWPDPLFFDVSGYYGQRFSYDTSPNPFGSTALLVGFDTYKITLWVDFALVALTLNSSAPDLQSCCLPGPSCTDVTPADCLLQAGTPLGGDTSCSCTACALPPPPPPVPDGRAATTPLRATRSGPVGDVLRVTWDAASCPATGYNLIHGDPANIASYTLTGAACSIGTTGSFDWSGVPAGNLWFLIVGTDGAATESSWGRNAAGQERNGTAPSGACGVSAKDVSATCP